MHSQSNVDIKLQTTNAKTALESMFRPAGSSNDSQQDLKRPREDDDEEDQAHDEVRLWEDGFKDRYYESKFDVGSDQLEFR